MTITINATEKDIEDVLVKNMDHFLGLRFVGRQINTPAGVVDILARSSVGHYYIIELKRGAVDPSAYAQVMRYCHYFNFNKSKDGKRIFAPLLIGESLADEMVKNVSRFEKNGESHDLYSYMPEYALFNFNPLSGISFSYYSTMAQKYSEEYFYNQRNHAQRVFEDQQAENFAYFYREKQAEKKLKEGAG